MNFILGRGWYHETKSQQFAQTPCSIFAIRGFALAGEVLISYTLVENKQTRQRWTLEENPTQTSSGTRGEGEMVPGQCHPNQIVHRRKRRLSKPTFINQNLLFWLRVAPESGGRAKTRGKPFPAVPELLAEPVAKQGWARVAQE